MNIAHHVETNRRLLPNKPALVFEDQQFTYNDLDMLASRCGNALRGLGVRQGDRVALLLPNIPEWVIAYLGILKIGAVVVSLNTMLQQPEVAFALNDCMVQAIITTPQLLERLPEQGRAWSVITTEPCTDTIDFKRLIAKASPELRAVEVGASTPAAIVYTSGTTGVPKGATLSHGNVHSNMIAKQYHCGTRPDDRLLLFLPLFHCFGQNAILNHGLHAGATIILQRRFDPDTILDELNQHQVTMFFGVPTVYMRLLDLDIPPQLLRSVRYFFVAGAPMPVEIAQRWQQCYSQPVYEGYGLTETSPFASYNHHHSYKVGSIGMPIQHVAMQIVDGEGRPLVAGERGEIVVRGPNIMLGYWNRPQETAEAIRSGWFHTGDIGMMDEEGYFYVVDRLKDMISVSSFKVYPAEVEHVIYQHPTVAEVAVYGVPDQIKGEVVRASVKVRSGQVGVEEDILRFCRERIAKFKLPERIEFVEALPKNATGKILKQVLRNQAG